MVSKIFGLTKGGGATPVQSIRAGIGIMYQKGLQTKSGNTSWIGGNTWDTASKNYNGGGAANYGNVLIMRDASITPKPSNLIFNKNKGSDAGWTGGIVLNVGGVEAGYQNFSGYWAEFPNRPKGDLYSAENRAAGNGNYHQSLNRAFNFVRKGNFSGGIYSGAWFQNIIHDNISKDAKYIYNNQGKVNTTIGQ